MMSRCREVPTFAAKALTQPGPASLAAASRPEQVLAPHLLLGSSMQAGHFPLLVGPLQSPPSSNRTGRAES